MQTLEHYGRHTAECNLMISTAFITEKDLKWEPEAMTCIKWLREQFIKGGVGTFEKPARDTLCVIFHGMLLTSR